VKSARIGIPINRGDAFLSSPEWIERPWKLLSKTPLDELTDVLFGYHAILHKSRKVFQMENPAGLQVGLCEIITECLKFDSALRNLYVNFGKSASGLLYWPELSTFESHLDDARLGKVFPVSFHFPAFFVAQVVTTYWAGMMAIHHLLMSTYGRLAEIESLRGVNRTTDSLPWPTSTDTVPSSLRSQEHSTEWKTMVKNICQSAEYFLQDKMSISGPLAILVQLLGCKRNLEGDSEDQSREIMWITDIVERIQKKVDFPIEHILGA
jgi:hypothetical protein